MSFSRTPAPVLWSVRPRSSFTSGKSRCTAETTHGASVAVTNAVAVAGGSRSRRLAQKSSKPSSSKSKSLRTRTRGRRGHVRSASPPCRAAGAPHATQRNGWGSVGTRAAELIENGRIRRTRPNAVADTHGRPKGTVVKEGACTGGAVGVADPSTMPPEGGCIRMTWAKRSGSRRKQHIVCACGCCVIFVSACAVGVLVWI
eukprot:2667229-Prymnesium_polylepis.1